MHYATRRSQWKKKHMFHVKYLGMLFVISVSVSPEHGKLCIDVSRPGTGMHYVTPRFHRMQ
jgi:hypothetical protein